MAPACAPLCHFGDRLYFTTFPHPAPSPQFLNSTASNPGNTPKIRPQPQIGPPADPQPTSTDNDAIYYYFTIDDQLLYTSFYQDWGPLNLAMVYKACLLIHGLLKDDDLSSHRLVLYSSDDPRRKANAALLMALYMLILHNYTPWRCFQPISELEFMSFRDAGRGPSTFNLSIYDCLWGFWKAMQNRLIDLDVFDLEDYEFHEKVENGDWNWITPNFIAFASPRDYAWTKQKNDMQNNAAEGPPSPARPGVALPNSPRKLALQRKLNPAFCICLDYFEKHKVDLVVRLNAELYDKQLFLERGIKHLDLCFEDGSNPSDEIVRTFIEVSDAVIESGGIVAVHCKAGLGRTGTLIGAYLIWKYGFTATEAIAFMRIIRPGCVVGPQQHYMHQMQLQWAKWSAVDEIRRFQAADAAAAVVPVVTPATPPAEQDEVMLEERSSTPSGATPIPLPITPGRAIVSTTSETPPPGQPRKTPMAKRIAIHSDDEDEEMEDTLPTLGVAPPVARPRARTTTRLSGARGTTSEQRPTRVLRSAKATTQRQPVASRVNRVAAPPPNKLPRLTTGTVARNNAIAAKGPGAPSARRVPQPPSPTPSRLPTLAKKQNPAPSLAELPNTRSSKPETWTKAGANAIVMPPSKSTQRPGPRPVRRRRSSFSAADVVA